MEKSVDAFRTISEVADDLDVPKHVLRFWEGKFIQLRPLKRGGGRRYYRPGDVELLKGIRRLLYDEGYTIKGVQKVLRDHGVDFVKGVAIPEAALAGASSGLTASQGQVHVNGAARSGRSAGASSPGRKAPAASSEQIEKELRAALAALEKARKLLGSDE